MKRPKHYLLPLTQYDGHGWYAPIANKPPTDTYPTRHFLRLTVSVLSVTGANDMGLGAMQHKAGQQNREAGQDEDFQELQAAAMQRVTSQKVVVPTPSRKNMKEIDVRKLTKSQKNTVLDQALQVLLDRVLFTPRDARLGHGLSVFPTFGNCYEHCKYSTASY